MRSENALEGSLSLYRVTSEKHPREHFRIIIRGGTVTRGYGFGYVSDMHPGPS